MIRKTYKFRLYGNKYNRLLRERIEICAEVWNHFLSLQKRYYRLGSKYISFNKACKHLTKLKSLKKYSHWWSVDSQSLQDVLKRQDRAYKKFFKWCKIRTGRRISPPKFKKIKAYNSFTLKQSGWSLLSDEEIRIQGRAFKFCNPNNAKNRRKLISDFIKIKTVTIKRDRVGQLWICFSVETEQEVVSSHHECNKILSLDFGLKTFLTTFDGESFGQIQAPEILKKNLSALKKANRNLAKKVKGSNRRKKARKELSLLHRKIANERGAWQWGTANKLIRKNCVLVFETLNFSGMDKLFGRKIKDLAPYNFMQKVQRLALKHDCEIIFADRFFPSSKLCHICSCLNENLCLRDRIWTCACGTVHNRDENASANLYAEGIRLRKRSSKTCANAL